ncbi:MAG TPA: 2,3,4,5-tetrahydropyridine-2,6-dicarboxylate N-succinyltransferase [Acidimicrobiales bacterium]|nr:MAG: 2,3,4,5-tetrahydropyridine-2,6-dicarboxylate N-succinyltransferase [Actinobacteria bacterium 21-64-8]HQT99538.1 2,3,4,5-tetrahydropyridine-2,6-dicarboxylate N-succinyltransferase [Acidimicrobiales bacterium]
MELEARISRWFSQISELTPESVDARRDVELVITKLDDGQVRVAELDPAGSVVVHEWVKQAILLLFRLRALERLDAGPFEYLDKLDLKHDFERRGVRVVPGASARRGSFLSPGVILMPSYVNIGAWVGPNTMVDTWATVGSCAQIGANVHLAGGVGIGGVLEPANAVPVVIEDDAFIGSRCMVTEGARVGRGSVLGAGTILNPSIPVIDAATGAEVSRGHVPDYCVAVMAQRRREFAGGEFFLPCVLIIQRLSEGERHDKVALNDILRDHGVAT